ncbi:hypothetical protein VTP01DRAFT_2580 [Rhizomucor pusillus]|uniref:uncharacterized protein n=1 Tax=Rhizomucor pusillus TaxID=4840 RepID=UPI00374325E0
MQPRDVSKQQESNEEDGAEVDGVEADEGTTSLIHAICVVCRQHRGVKVDIEFIKPKYTGHGLQDKIYQHCLSQLKNFSSITKTDCSYLHGEPASVSIKFDRHINKCEHGETDKYVSARKIDLLVELATIDQQNNRKIVELSAAEFQRNDVTVDFLYLTHKENFVLGMNFVDFLDQEEYQQILPMLFAYKKHILAQSKIVDNERRREGRQRPTVNRRADAEWILPPTVFTPKR